MLDLEKPALESLRVDLPPDDLSIPEITLDLGEQDELRRVQLQAMTAHMLRQAMKNLGEQREALEVATTSIRAVTGETTIGEATLAKERYRICRSKFLAKRNAEQKKLAAKYSELLDRIEQHPISDNLTLAIIEGDEQKIVRHMILGKLLDNNISSTFPLKYGDKTCPRCKGRVAVGQTAIFDVHRAIAHASCYGAALILRRAA